MPRKVHRAKPKAALLPFLRKAPRYQAIQGKELSPETVKAMDKGGRLGEVRSAVLIGGKYYIINTNSVYTYENGEFVKSDKKVRASATPDLTGDALNTLADIDYSKAVSSMITP